MRPILDIGLKDLAQLVRNKMTFLFLLVMPIIFTVMFGLAFGGFGSQPSEQRFPIGYLDLDQSEGSEKLTDLLSRSAFFYLEGNPDRSKPDLESLVSRKALAAAVIVPEGYGETVRDGTPIPLIVISDPGNTASFSIENEISRIASQMANAALTVQVVSSTLGVDSPDSMSEEVMQAWQSPPVVFRVTHSALTEKPNSAAMSLAHTAPGMMLQFAIASLLTSAQILVNERKTRSLQRLMTTRVARWQILAGHFLAIFVMLVMQFTILIAFGQWVLGLDYMRLPLATVLMTLASTACLAALGLLIGTLAKTDEQVIIFSLIPMFVFAGLGGAWVPLEVTGETFRTIGHLTPVAWGMDGYKNIIARGLGSESVTIPVLALFGYGILFFTIASWLFVRSEER
jgi:ABC-2 type transport system permease protein